jgi:acyl-coenzyme A synthetase/AMP-(fatty) acid ligase
MTFAESFLEQATKNPNSTFVSQGDQSVTFGESLSAIRSMSSSEALKVALAENSIKSVIGWLAVEFARGSTQKEAPVDFVQTSGSTGRPKTFYINLSLYMISNVYQFRNIAHI